MATEKMQRCEKIGWFVVENNATVRDAAIVFDMCKSTVHRDLTKILPGVNSLLANEVKQVLKNNKVDAPRRGGEATKRKYEIKREMHAYKPSAKISLTAKMEYEPEKEIEHLNDALSN